MRAFRDRRGVAAVEFALLLPLMLLMYIGASDVTRGVMASRDVDILSRTISDLVAQQSTTSDLTPSTISTFFSTGAAIMAPFNTSSLKMTVSAVNIGVVSGTTTCCQAVVYWSYTQGGTARTCTSQGSANALTQVADGTPPSPTTIPASIVNANVNAGFGYSASKSSYLIVADVTYSYTPFFSQAAAWFAPAIKKTTYMVPRATSGQITLAAPLSPGTGQSGCTSYSSG